MFRPCYRIQSAVAQNFHIDLSGIHASLLRVWAPPLTEVLRFSFEHGNTVEIHKGIRFDFYPGLPHIVTLSPIYSSYWQYSMSSVRSISVFLKNCSNTTFFFSSSPPLNACVKEIWKKEKLAVYWHVPVLYTWAYYLSFYSMNSINVCIFHIHAFTYAHACISLHVTSFTWPSPPDI